MDNRRNDITRISELPENGPGSSGNGSSAGTGFGMAGGQGSEQYKPLNIHQNPYGIPEPEDRQLPSINVKESSRQRGGGGGSDGFSGEGFGAQPPTMMNRGGHQEMSDHMMDEQIIANHIPKPKLTTDYLRDYEDKFTKMSAEHQKTKHQESLITSVYDELQIPILIGLMFFLFQMPIVNSLMYKYLAFMKLYGEDGNLNLYGLVFKSTLFGLFYFLFIRVTTYLS